MGKPRAAHPGFLTRQARAMRQRKVIQSFLKVTSNFPSREIPTLGGATHQRGWWRQVGISNAKVSDRLASYLNAAVHKRDADCDRRLRHCSHCQGLRPVPALAEDRPVAATGLNGHSASPVAVTAAQQQAAAGSNACLCVGFVRQSCTLVQRVCGRQAGASHATHSQELEYVYWRTLPPITRARAAASTVVRSIGNSARSHRSPLAWRQVRLALASCIRCGDDTKRFQQDVLGIVRGEPTVCEIVKPLGPVRFHV